MLDGYIAFLGETPLNSREGYVFPDQESAEAHAKGLESAQLQRVRIAKLYPLDFNVSGEPNLIVGYAAIIETNETGEITPSILAIKEKFEDASASVQDFKDGRRTEVRKLILMADLTVLDDMISPNA